MCYWVSVQPQGTYPRQDALHVVVTGARLSQDLVYINLFNCNTAVADAKERRSTRAYARGLGQAEPSHRLDRWLAATVRALDILTASGSLQPWCWCHVAHPTLHVTVACSNHHRVPLIYEARIPCFLPHGQERIIGDMAMLPSLCTSVLVVPESGVTFLSTFTSDFRV